MKRLAILLTMMVCLGTMVACGNSDGTANEQTSQPTMEETGQPVETQEPQEPQATQASDEEAEADNVDRFTKYFEMLKEEGFDVREVEDEEVEAKEATESIEAKRGKGFSVNEEFVAIFEYDPNDLTENGKKNYESAKSKGEIEIDGEMFRFEFHDDLVLYCNDHTEEERLIEIFKKL